MSVLFPPIIENILPAFSESMSIPFLLSMGVSEENFSSILVKINNTYTQKTIGILEIEKTNLIYSNGKY